jgi:hypothetical protein
MAWKDDNERYAASVVERALSVHVEPTDVPGAPQGTVDGEIQYPDGRPPAALEVTSVQPQALFHLQKKLAGRETTPAPGRYSWSIHPETAADLKRLDGVHERIIRLTEEHGRRRPDDLPIDMIANDSDLQWIAWDSRSTMAAYDMEGEPLVYWWNPDNQFRLRKRSRGDC